MWTARIWKKVEGRKYHNIYRFLQRSQYWTIRQIREYQLSKIKKLVYYAYYNVPYYRDMMDKIGLIPDDIKSFHDFSRLPVLTKDIIRTNFSGIVSNVVNESDKIANSTGGSTGEPLQFYQDINFELWADAARNRGWYDIANCKVGDTCAVVWGAMNEVKVDFSLAERMTDYFKNGFVMLNAFNLSDYRIVEFIRYCNIVKPKLLRGYTTALYELAKFIDKNRIEFPRLSGVILCAETVHEKSRKYIENIFKAPSFNTYGGRELSLIAMECSEQDGLHEISENNYIEYEPIEIDGHHGAGNLIITNLNNYTMPFIRYRIGDIGIRSSNAPCACGRGLPKIKRIIGRSTEVFTFSDGTKIAGEMFIHLMKDFPVTEYQFVQKGVDAVILRYKKGDKIDMRVFNDIKRLYNQYLPDCVNLSFEGVCSFEKTLTGKFKFVLKENED